ncbi:MAG: PatB family C-S lyase [Bacteroidales bacterium]|nr:PatB family C-S lyase [Candidatus Cryptobacteroides equifaecalis]
MYNFDKIIDRSGSGCIKTDCLKDTFGREDVLPMWIADMDWETPDFIVEALRKRLEHPIFGYPHTPDDYFPMIAGWVKRLLGWEVNPDHIRYIPGIVKGFAFAQRCFLNPGDKVIIQPPVYHPFRITTENIGHEVVYNPLIPVYDEDGFLCDYRMDFDGLEAAIDGHCKMLILCNPHNPGGVCWSRETLIRLAKICHRHGIMVISDEIHGEMAFCEHSPYASVCPEAAENSISFLAPSKTFNLAGIVTSYCIIPDEKVRNRFFKYIEDCEIDYASIFSVVATQAAYTKGWEWRREMMEYLKGNFDFVDEYLRTNIPQIRSMRPQASFLMWLDCHKLGLNHDQLIDLFVNKAKLGLNDGAMFGKEGEGFMRLNVGCPRAIVKEALDRLRDAVAKL